MKLAAVAFLTMLAACTDPGDSVDQSAFDGSWSAQWQECQPVVADDCARPMVVQSVRAAIDSGTISWMDADGLIAVHDGEVFADAQGSGVIVADGEDDTYHRGAYFLVPFDGPGTLAGGVTWNPGARGECSCVVTLRR